MGSRDIKYMKKQIKSGDYIRVLGDARDNGIMYSTLYTNKCKLLGFDIEAYSPCDKTQLIRYAKVVRILNKAFYIINYEKKYYVLFKDYAEFFCRDNFEIRKQIYEKEKRYKPTIGIIENSLSEIVNFI